MNTGERNPREILRLRKLERLVMEYFIQHISVGELIAILDLKEEVKKKTRLGETDLVSELEDPIIVRELYLAIAMLVKNGFLEYRNGAYRLPDWLIKVIKNKKGSLMPGIPKSLRDIIGE